MDTVFIEGLEVDTVIGAYDWERGIRQCLQLDLTLGWDIRPAARNDELDKALDYAKVAAAIDQFAAEARFELVETFAERLARACLEDGRVQRATVRIEKPGALVAVAAPGCEIVLGR